MSSWAKQGRHFRNSNRHSSDSSKLFRGRERKKMEWLQTSVLKKPRRLSFTPQSESAPLFPPQPFSVGLRGLFESFFFFHFYRIIRAIIHLFQVVGREGSGSHSSCRLSCRTTWQVVSGPAERMEKWGSGSSPGRRGCGGSGGEDWSRMEAGTALSPTVGAFL